MSIILKALKKAEKSRAEKTAIKTIVYKEKGEKIRGIFLGLVAVSVISLFVFIYLYLLPNIAPKRPSVLQKQPEIPPTAMTTQTPQSAEPELPDISKLNADAVEEIKKGNYTTAESLLKKAIEIDKEDATLYNNLGLALRGQSRYKEAIQAYEKALQLKPDFPETLNNIALAIELSGNKNKALEFYKRAIALRPAYPEAHLNIALLLESIDNKKEAESHYHTFLNISKDEELKKTVKERLSAIKK